MKRLSNSHRKYFMKRMEPLSKCYVAHDPPLLYHNSPTTSVSQRLHSWQLCYLILSNQTFTKKRSPYFHVYMVPPYKVFLVEREAIVPDQ